jgi:hypothetical protein
MRQRVSRIAAVFVCFLIASALLGAQAADTVYVTRTGAKYHRAGCSSLTSSSIPMPLTDAAAKYQPCKICKPPVAGPTTGVVASPANSPSAKTAPVERAVESGRCQAITKKGTQCSRKAKAGSKFCWQHG